MKYCAKCTVKSRFTGKTRQGRWQPTHYTDEHKGPTPSANLSEDPPPKTKTVSFKNALLAAQNEEGDE